MTENTDLMAKDDVWSNVFKVVNLCTETEDAIEDVIAFRRKLELFSVDQIFDYYFERETNPKEEFVWCIASIAYAYFGKVHYGSWFAAQWLLFDIVHGSFGKFTDYLNESLSPHKVIELSDFSMGIASDNYGWGLNANGPYQIYSLIMLRKIAGRRRTRPSDDSHCFSRNFYRLKKYNQNWRELGIFLETTDAVYFSLAAILAFSDDETVDIGSLDDATEFTLSICDETSLDDLENIQSIRDIVEKGKTFDSRFDDFSFSRENYVHSVDDRMIEFALGLLSNIERTLNEQA